jgi:hypothetical protein
MVPAQLAANDLSPNKASDRNQKRRPGYRMLEEWLNSIDSF